MCLLPSTFGVCPRAAPRSLGRTGRSACGGRRHLALSEAMEPGIPGRARVFSVGRSRRSKSTRSLVPTPFLAAIPASYAAPIGFLSPLVLGHELVVRQMVGATRGLGPPQEHRRRIDGVALPGSPKQLRGGRVDAPGLSGHPDIDRLTPPAVAAAFATAATGSSSQTRPWNNGALTRLESGTGGRR